MRKLDWFIILFGVIATMTFIWQLERHGQVMIPAENCIITTTEHRVGDKQEHLYYCTWSTMK